MPELADRKISFKSRSASTGPMGISNSNSPQSFNRQRWPQVYTSHIKTGRATNMQIICNNIVWQRLAFSLVFVICLPGRDTHRDYFSEPGVGLAPCVNVRKRSTWEFPVVGLEPLFFWVSPRLAEIFKNEQCNPNPFPSWSSFSLVWAAMKAD